MSQPNTPDRVARFQAIVELSEAMLDTARAGDWSTLQEQEQQRSALLHTFFAEPVTPADAPEIRRGVERMLVLNETIIALGTEAKAAMGESMKELSKGRKAAAAYGRHSR